MQETIETETFAGLKLKPFYEVCDLVDAGVGTEQFIYRMLKTGAIRGTRLGKKWIIHGTYVHQDLMGLTDA